MKNLTDRNKKWLTITGLGVVCIALVIAISFQFKTEKPKDNALAPSFTVTGEVNPSPGARNPADAVVQSNGQTPSAAVSTGTEQTIQPDPVKPEAPKETPKPQGETANPSKAPTYNPEDTTVSKPAEPKAGEKKDGKIYVPGFGWIEDNGGGGEGKAADDMYENGNKIGKMN